MPTAWVPNLQLLPLKNQMAYLLQTLSVVLPGFIKISSWCKLNGWQPVHEENMFVLLQVNAKVGTPRVNVMFHEVGVNHAQNLTGC